MKQYVARKKYNRWVVYDLLADKVKEFCINEHKAKNRTREYNQGKIK
jgi:hypothetical protein